MHCQGLRRILWLSQNVVKVKTFEMQRRDLRSQNCAPHQKTRRCRNAAVVYMPALSARRTLDDPVWTRGSLRTVVESPVEFSPSIFFSATIRSCSLGVWQLHITSWPLLDWGRRVWQDKR
jgi:hypothetical protein